MLDHVPFQELLYKSDKQQSFKDLQVHTLMHEDMTHTRPHPLHRSTAGRRAVLLQCMMHAWRRPLHRSSHRGRSLLLSPGISPDISHPTCDVATKSKGARRGSSPV